MVILYSTDCPKCSVLKKKLDAAGVQYTENHDVNLMLELGITSVPVLSVGDVLLEFGDAVRWIEEQ